MPEARGLVQECISRGDESSGFEEFTALAPGLVALPDKGYRLYVETLFDEIGREVRVLFDRRDVASLLWPRRQPLGDLLGLLNDTSLASVWGEDETIGWVYQYFNGDDERRKMRDESQAPRDLRILPIENKRNFLDVSSDVLENVDPVFYGDLRQAAFKALGMN